MELEFEIEKIKANPKLSVTRFYASDSTIVSKIKDLTKSSYSMFERVGTISILLLVIMVVVIVFGLNMLLDLGKNPIVQSITVFFGSLTIITAFLAIFIFIIYGILYFLGLYFNYITKNTINGYTDRPFFPR